MFSFYVLHVVMFIIAGKANQKERIDDVDDEI